MSEALKVRTRQLEPGVLVELYVLDLTPNGGTVYHWHNSTQNGDNIINFQGDPYFPYPIKAEGFELTTQGTLPRPKVSVSNLGGFVSALLRQYDDFVGCTVIRKRTFEQFLDDGATPDATQEYPPDVYTIDRRSLETNSVVEFELSTKMDVERVMLPRRQIIANACQWIYRGPECGYTGPPVADQYGNPIGFIGHDGFCTAGDATFVATAANFTSFPAVGHKIVAPGFLEDLAEIISVGPGIHTVELSKVAKATGSNIDFTVAGEVTELGLFDPFTAYQYPQAVYTIVNGVQQHYFNVSPTLIVTPITNIEVWKGDQCAKDLRACKMRFGNNGILPTSAFPGSSRIPR